MKSVEEAFAAISLANPKLSSLLCFMRVVRHRKLSRTEVAKQLTELVDKDDYTWTERGEVIDHAMRLTNEPRAERRSTKTSLKESSSEE